MNLWQLCQGEQQIRPVRGQLYRFVESQEQIATLGYVDTLEEQALLEQLLDEHKPAYAPDTSHLHYLLQTPFRYPPLRFGSRFGSTFEPGIFYGGTSISVTLAEAAYYRLLFWYSMQAEPPKPQILSAHTLFSVRYQADKGIQLHQPPFAAYQPQLCSKTDYQLTQQLGSAMRGAAVAVVEYQSARDPAGGRCVGLFNPAAFASNTPDSTAAWWCELTAAEVSFKAAGDNHIHRFALSLFTQAGKLPQPA